MGYRALTGLTFPAPEDLPRVVEAGGLKGLQKADPEAFAGVMRRLRRVEAGQPCDDIPDVSVAAELARGRIELVDEPPPAPSLRRRRASAGE